MSHERFAALAAVGPRYSESTLNKHKWVIKLYEAFSVRSGIDPWPLDPTNAGWFVRFIGIEARYAVGSIEDVIIPSLKRLNKTETGEDPSKGAIEALSLALRDVKRSKSKIKEGERNEPAIDVDVKRIIEFTPEGVVSKAAEASLWLTSLSTGARALTCYNVVVRDIVRVIKKPESDKVFIQIMYRVTKGNERWNHIVTLEGDPNTKDSMNVAYWLNKHLVNSFGVDLHSINDLSESVKNQHLWPWSKDSMRQLFKTRAQLSGFPYDLFSFHSLRSGFLCSALIKAGTDNNEIRAVLEHTAFVAGWVPYKPAQLRYVKDSAKRTIVSSRLVLSKDEEIANNEGVVDPTLASSENFHNITLLESSWDPETNYMSFQALINKAFTVDSLPERERKSLNAKCWRNAFNKFVRDDPQLEDKAKLIYLTIPSWNQSRYKWSTEANTRAMIGRQHIASILRSDFDKLSDLSSLFIALVHDDLNMINPLKLYKRKRTLDQKPCLLSRATYEESSHRKRLKWSVEEDKLLVKGKQGNLSFVSISEQMMGIRSNIDCKDRWRNLLKKHLKDQDKLFATFA